MADIDLDLIDYKPDEGVITDGFCATPEAQADFDQNLKGEPPLNNNDD
ncbi:MAG: hypothetical protein PHT38_06450 [Halothiobacillus sp.]|nr:hypothetical protein [Halothiobacillus sp.]